MGAAAGADPDGNMSAEIPLLLSAYSIALTAPSNAAEASAFISFNCEGWKILNSSVSRVRVRFVGKFEISWGGIHASLER